ncbi:MAG: hemolysin III family protein [Tetrasphaera sp.]|nr:hemolysin III family protein [Tetrasphaera sp.]
MLVVRVTPRFPAPPVVVRGLPHREWRWARAHRGGSLIGAPYGTVGTVVTVSRKRPERQFGALRDNVEGVVEEAREAANELAQQVKPKLRGWLHAAMAPIALLAGMVLIVLAPSRTGRITAAVFTLTAFMLFGTSAVYHRGAFSPRVTDVLKRLDHSNIFLIIAGSYTPFALLLPRKQAITMLLIVWIGAVGGVLFRVLWVRAPRWLYVPIYVALGWVAVFYLGPLWDNGGTLVLALIVTGGLLYTLGAVVYGIKRPNPWPSWFGFHEIFHALTILAFISHYIAATIVLHREAG